MRAQLPRLRNDKRKFVQASKCIAARFEGKKNLGSDRKAGSCYFRKTVSDLPPQVVFYSYKLLSRIINLINRLLTTSIQIYISASIATKLGTKVLQIVTG